ncbi:MAG: hypothetical protein IT289_06875 [Oligoflexia bacterium]|nr:hypothetical protein [Oligoflexia bacterium]
MKQIGCSFDQAGTSLSLTVGQKFVVVFEPGQSLEAEPVISYKGELKEHALQNLGAPEVLGTQVKQTFASYQVGLHELNQLALTSGKEEYRCQNLKLEINSVLESPEATPVPSFAPVAAAIPLWWWLMMAVLILGAIGLITYWILKYRKRKAQLLQQAAQKKILTPEETYFQRLRKLDSQGLHQKGEYKAFALELTQIVKEGLGKQFKFNAEDLTSEEILAWLEKRASAFHDSMGSACQGLFQNLDQIKFAKVEVTSEFCQSLLDGASHIGRGIFKGGGV